MKAGAVVEIEQVHETVLGDEVVEAAKEEGSGLRRPHHDIHAVAGGRVEEEEGDPAQAGSAGPEVFAITEHALHSLYVHPPPHVALVLAGTRTGGQAHASAGPPDGGPVHSQIGGDDAADLGTAKQLGDTGPGVTLLLGPEEGDHGLAQYHGGQGPPAAPGLQSLEATSGVGRPPTLEGTHADPNPPTMGMGVLSPGDLTHSGPRGAATQDKSLDLGEHRVAQQRLGGRSSGEVRWSGRIVHDSQDGAASAIVAPGKVVGGGLRLRGEEAVGCSG